MPLLNHKPHCPLPPPDRESLPGKRKRVFYMQQTREIFPTYEQYANRFMLYRQPIWQCATTGKTGLTYQEACQSEAKAAFDSGDQFCDQLKELILRYIHGKTEPLRQVIDEVVKRIRHNYFDDEFVYFTPPEFKRTLRHAKIVTRICTDPGYDFATDHNGDGAKGAFRYTIQCLAENGKPLDDTQRTVTATEIRRPRVNCTRHHIKALIRDCSTRSTSANAPLLLKPEYRELYSIQDDGLYNYDEQELMLHGNLTSLGDTSEPDARSSPAPPDLKAKKANRRNALADTDAAVIRSPTSGRIVLPAGKTALAPQSPRKANGKKTAKLLKANGHGRRSESPASVIVSREPTPKPPPIKYPIDDLQLLTMPTVKSAKQAKLDFGSNGLSLTSSRAATPDSTKDVTCPAPSFDFFLAPAAVERLLHVWSFLNVYSKPLALSPFTLDEFEQALLHKSTDQDETPCRLLVEALCSCINAIIDDVANDKEGRKLSLLDSGINDLTSPTLQVEDSAEEMDEDAIAADAMDVDSTPAAGSRIQGGLRLASPVTESSDVNGQRQDLNGLSTGEQPRLGKPADGSVASTSNQSRRDPQSALRYLKRCLATEWFQALISAGRKNWERAFLGWLQYNVAQTNALKGIMQYLCELYAKTPADFMNALESLTVDEKLTIFEQLVNDTSASWTIRNFIEECHENLSALRKDRIEANKELKKATDERQQLVKELEAPSHQGSPAPGGDGAITDTDRAVSSADLRKAARVKEYERQEGQRALRKAYETEDRLTRRVDQLNRSARRDKAFRVTPLGMDRYYNSYWFFDGIGGALSNGTGRLFVKYVTPGDPTLQSHDWSWDRLVQLMPADAYPPLRHLQTMSKSTPIATANGSSTPAWSALWGYYSQPEELEQLLQWLNPKGVREMALLTELEYLQPAILRSMKKRQQDLASALRAEPIRRSVRQRPGESDPPLPAYMNYTNKLAE
ncbi:hypothetical protein H4R35_002689 [Dimargaris xerosporica]|nr:hypothetical protein H4R35_002689 [Dimargaris xerosporica]